MEVHPLTTTLTIPSTPSAAGAPSPSSTSIPLPTALPSSNRCCRFTHLKSGILSFATFISIAGLFGALLTPNMPNRELYVAAFAVLAITCLYFAKDSFDHENQLNNVVTDRLLAQQQLQDTEGRLTDTQSRLEATEKQLQNERRKLEDVAYALGVNVANLGKENTRLERNIDHMQEILQNHHVP